MKLRAIIGFLLGFSTETCLKLTLMDKGEQHLHNLNEQLKFKSAYESIGFKTTYMAFREVRIPSLRLFI